MGNYFCFKVLQNSFQKNTDVFWKVWEPQYHEANNVICSVNFPRHLEKDRSDIIHHQKKRIGSISYLYLIRNDSLFLIPPAIYLPDNERWKLRGVFSNETEISGSSRIEKRLTEKRGGWRKKEKTPTRNGWVEEAENSKKVNGLIIWPQIISKNTIQNGLSALLRACRPGRLVLVCGAMQDSFQKTRTFFGASGSRNITKQ